MYKNITKLIYLFLIIFINIFQFINSKEIFVKYDTGKPYNSSDCGDLANPCATLKEAMDNVINSTDTISNTIVLLGSVVGGTTFLGNLYGLCTKLVIKSQNLTNIVKIDGINATEPFFFFSEPDGSSEGTNHCGTFAINLNSLNFENWNTLIKFNITHNTPESPDIQSPIIINIVSCNVTSSKSIVYIQPRNFVPHKLYNGDTITIRFSSSIVTGLLPSDLLVPGSLVDYLPPFYVVGGSISFLSKTIITNNEVSTPLVFLQNGDFLFGVGQIINLNRFSSGHPVFVLGNATVSFLGIFQENELSSFLFFDNCSFSGSSLSFPNNTITSFTGFGNKFLGNTYANSFMVFKNMDCIYPFSINLNQPQEGSFDGSMFYFENNHITLSENIYTPLFEISSFIESVNSNVIILSKIPITVTHPIIGRDSSIIFQDWIVPSLDNETFCGCSNCNYFSNGLDTGVISIDTTEKYSSCNEKPTPTPSSSTSSSSSSQQSSSSETPTPTTTDVSSTPPPSSSQLTSSSESSMSPFKKKVIIITSVVLGSASITLVSIFSVLYRIRKNKEYLLNSMTSNPSSEDGDVAAAADNDVSPNLESTIDMMDHDDEDCAQLEKL